METDISNMNVTDKSFEAYIPQGLEVIKGMRISLETLQPAFFQRRLGVSYEVATLLLEYLVQSESLMRES